LKAKCLFRVVMPTINLLLPHRKVSFTGSELVFISCPTCIIAYLQTSIFLLQCAYIIILMLRLIDIFIFCVGLAIRRSMAWTVPKTGSEKKKVGHIHILCMLASNKIILHTRTTGVNQKCYPCANYFVQAPVAAVRLEKKTSDEIEDFIALVIYCIDSTIYIIEKYVGNILRFIVVASEHPRVWYHHVFIKFLRFKGQRMNDWKMVAFLRYFQMNPV
ncbi:hypothetical protein ACJX0J_040910, partial [Zea mays]